jgi:hypothetical protein
MRNPIKFGEGMVFHSSKVTVFMAVELSRLGYTLTPETEGEYVRVVYKPL